MTLKKEAQKKRWLEANYGALNRLAKKLNLSRVFVGEIYWEKKQSKDNRVESELEKLGAPGFDRPLPDPSQARHYPDLALDLVDLPR
jgi:hypothetical protein